MPRPTEDELIARYLAPLAGPGAFDLRDDAAALSPPDGRDLVVTTDMLVAGVHFFADDPPGAIARKALRVNLSDLAAKGAAPTGFLLGLGLPQNWTQDWLAGFVAGLGADADAFACPLLGGDTVGTPGPLFLSITAFGTVPAGRMVPRPGARAGDTIYVTGTIGDAALGLRIRWNEAEDREWIAALSAADREALLARHRQPEPRLALSETLRSHGRCAMDVSDGFLGDLAKMLALEGLGAAVTATDVPLSPSAHAAAALQEGLLETALSGGDDYEILCCVAPEERANFEAAARDAGVAVAAVGVARPGATTLRVGDRRLDPARGAFKHFG